MIFQVVTFCMLFEKGNYYLSQPLLHDGLIGVGPLQLTDTAFAGGLNINSVYRSEYGDDYVLRTPKGERERRQTVQSITAEYEGIGAASEGVGFRLRTIGEQAELTNRLHNRGFSTLGCIELQNNQMLQSFMKGTTLCDYVENIHINPEKLDVVEEVLTHLNFMHRQGIVLGDRWCRNTMVMAQGEFAEFDYDLELIGPQKTIATFEMSQELYHLVHFSQGGRGFMTNFLQEYLRDRTVLDSYDSQQLGRFLRGHARYFTQTNELYENIKPPDEEIYQLADGIQLAVP